MEMKRLFSLLMALLLTVASMPSTALAADEEDTCTCEECLHEHDSDESCPFEEYDIEVQTEPVVLSDAAPSEEYLISVTQASMPLLAASSSSTAPGIGYCSTCRSTCAYTVGYEDLSDEYHLTRNWCSNCGYDQCGGVNTGAHVYDGSGQCVLCGHSRGTGGSVNVYDCEHPYTNTAQYGCVWYEVCGACGLLVNSGANHSYSYSPWENYSNTRHRRQGTCTACGETAWFYENHSAANRYESIGTTQHKYGSYCETCGTWIGRTTVSDHTFTYTNWTDHVIDRHQRQKVCRDCGYSEYEFGRHSFRYGEWEEYSDSQHRRSETCADCDHLRYEYENHSYTYSAWKSVTDKRHQRTAVCSCGYTKTESRAHQDSDSDGKCDDCGYVMEQKRFSVTVPSSLSLAMSETGQITAADSAAIINRSTEAVRVSSLTITAENGWTLVPYGTNMAREQVDSRHVGFSLNNVMTSKSGSAENMSIGSGWSIARDSSLPLSYDAVIAPLSESVTGQKILTLVFVVQWA